MSNAIPLTISEETIKAIESALNEIVINSANNILETQNSNQYMNKKQAAQYIGVSYNTLKKFIDCGLEVVKINDFEMIRRVDIDQFMEANKK